MSWFLSDEIPEIPADILEKLENRFDRGDCFDVAEAECERSSVRRVIAINQMIHRRLIVSVRPTHLPGPDAKGDGVHLI